MRRLEPVSPEALCTACGLCCDGTLFSVVHLAADEVDRIPLAVIAGHVPPAFRQPCPALEGTRCAIYATRPGACRRFDCLLLHALRSGELSAAEALAVVAEARARIGALPFPIAHARRAPGALLPADRPALETVERFLDRRFRGETRRR